MKSVYVADIERFSTGQPITTALFALDDVDVRTAATGAPYLSLSLTDITGSIRGVMFDQGTLPVRIGPGDPVSVSGVFNKDYNNINVKNIEQYVGDVEVDDFLATSSRDKNEMYRELLEIVGGMGDNHLRVLLLSIFQDPALENQFKIWPGAKQIHHAFTGGLLEHTLAVAKLCDTSVTLYDVDRDLTVAGALLHDIGKLRELDLKLTVTLTDIGSLHGHSILGANFVRDTMAEVLDFPDGLREQLLHIILSHHGEPEWGAVTRPMTLEALLVCMADNTDAKANRYQTLIRQQRPLEQSVSSKDYFLSTAVYAPRVGEQQ